MIWIHQIQDGRSVINIRAYSRRVRELSLPLSLAAMNTLILIHIKWCHFLLKLLLSNGSHTHFPSDTRKKKSHRARSHRDDNDIIFIIWCCELSTSDLGIMAIHWRVHKETVFWKTKSPLPSQVRMKIRCVKHNSWLRNFQKWWCHYVHAKWCHVVQNDVK